LLADKEPEKFDRAAVRWHVRFVYDSKNVGLGESLAVLALFAATPETVFAAEAPAELLSRRRGMERPCETLVASASSASRHCPTTPAFTDSSLTSCSETPSRSSTPLMSHG
jgi:hypothetical protein